MNTLSSFFLRAIPGAFILNAGLGFVGLHKDEEKATGLREFAAIGVPALKQLTPKQFGLFMPVSQLGVAGSLLLPFVPNRLAGAALTSFSAGLLSIYFNSPQMTKADGIRPTDEGLQIAKDVFMTAAGLALLADTPQHKVQKRAAKKALKRAKKEAKKEAKEAAES